MAYRSRDRRPQVAQAYDWASRITSISLTMTLPAAAGYWGDVQLGTSPWLVILGAVVGLGAGLTQLIRLSDQMTSKRPNVTRRPTDKSKDPDPK